MLILICFSILVVFSVAFFFKFLKADGDFTLMSRKQVKREEIEDKVVWITGASRGIGEVLARQLANFGAKLIISARNEVELERVKKHLTGKYAPDEVMLLPLDLSQVEEHLREAVQKAESCFGSSGVHYMFHNAAYERPKTTALDVTEESLNATFDVNVLGPISLTRLSSHAEARQWTFCCDEQCCRKGACPWTGCVLCFQICCEWLYKRGIKVTVVNPGPVKTIASEKSSYDTKSTTRSINFKGSIRNASSERCAELTIIAATHGLKEAWIRLKGGERKKRKYQFLNPNLILILFWIRRVQTGMEPIRDMFGLCLPSCT